MGEVYRARDERLKRDVAIKVLPASYSADADRLRRFEQEAQAAGGLNHPNLTAVYDFGTHEGAPYIVQELLEGETLRAELAGGRFSARRAVDTALQIARGLAAAHEKGIVHRDLKPENVFVTRDGRVKILDFGLAKLRPDETSPATNIPTAAAGTEPGVVLGTLGYMSPEQVRGKAADARSDIFSLGTILYEMLSGNRPFRGDSAADTMSAILREDPPELSLTNKNVSPGLERIVRHCLEKNAEQRFHSAHDVAFDLESLSGASPPSGIGALTPSRARRVFWPLIAAALAGAALVAAAAILLRPKRTEPPVFRQVTYRRGLIGSARFAPDGQNVVYTAAWEDNPPEIFQARLGLTESRPIGVVADDLGGVSSTGEMLVLQPTEVEPTLAQVPMTGGAPRPIAERVIYADISRNGRETALVRWSGSGFRLEYPSGKVLHESSGWSGHPRISPDGARVAFFDHPLVGDNRGTLVVIDRAGNKKTLTPEFGSAAGIAWSPSGDRIFFTAAEHGANLVVRSISPSGGDERRILSGPGRLILHDISSDGRLLIEERTQRRAVMCRPAGQTRERDLAWLDFTGLHGISKDGSMLLISETGEGGGERSSVFVRKTDGSAAVRLGDGLPNAFTPDDKGVLALVPGPTPKIVILPIGAGEPRTLSDYGLRLRGGRLLPDGKRLVVGGARPGGPLRGFLVSLDGSPIREVGPPAMAIPPMISPDGKWLFAIGGDDKAFLYPIDEAGEPRAVTGYQPGDWPAGWSADGRSLFLSAGPPIRVFKVDLETGRRDLWLDTDPGGSLRPPGSYGIAFVAADGKSYAYAVQRSLSELYVVEGVN
jgi:Tol biopolymer transport system component